MGRGVAKELASGDHAPLVGFQTLEAAPVSLSAMLSEGPVLLAFFKASCPTCQLTLPFLERLHGGAFRLFFVSQDGARTAKEFSRAFEISKVPVLLDPAGDGYPASNAFGLSYVPSMFLIEPDQQVSWSWVGFHKKQLETLAARAGRPIFLPGEKVPEAKSG